MQGKGIGEITAGYPSSRTLLIARELGLGNRELFPTCGRRAVIATARKSASPRLWGRIGIAPWGSTNRHITNSNLLA